MINFLMCFVMRNTLVVLDFDLFLRFGLFEAMSAIEMMDPKMDAGMMCNRGNKRPLNFDQAVAVRICIENVLVYLLRVNLVACLSSLHLVRVEN